MGGRLQGKTWTYSSDVSIILSVLPLLVELRLNIEELILSKEKYISSNGEQITRSYTSKAGRGDITY